MRFLFMLLIGFIIVGGVFYFFVKEQTGLRTHTVEAGHAAQDAAASYKANQEKMMQQLQQ